MSGDEAIPPPLGWKTKGPPESVDIRPVSSVEQMAPGIGKRQERQGRQEWQLS